MRTFRKHVLDAGRYEATRGSVDVTPARMQHWVDQFRAMKAANLRIPVPWGHVDSTPKTPDEEEFWRSKYNAGFVNNLTIEGGRLMAELDIPLADDARRVGTVVKEVSPEIRDRWRDGSGRLWNDAITHVALVQLPVVAGQDNFEPVATAAGTDFDGATVLRLSLSQLAVGSGERPMDDETLSGALTAEAPTENTPPAEPQMEKLKALLEGHHIRLGDDVTPENLMERLIVALDTKMAHEEKQKEEDAAEQAANAPPPATTETPPYAMSARTPAEKGMLRLLERSERNGLTTRIRHLLSSGRITPPIAQQLTDSAGKIQLSLNANGEPEAVPLGDKVALLEQLPAGACWEPGERLTRLSVTEVEAPEHVTADNPRNEMTDKQAEELTDKLFAKRRTSGEHANALRTAPSQRIF